MAPSRSRPRSSGIVTLLTDFGTRDAFVGIMKGVMLGIRPRLQFVDLTHDIEPQDVVAGALLLRSAVAYFPPGTVHLAVVDPGVGGSRRALVVATRRAMLVGPDNGLLLPAAERLGITSAHAIDVTALQRRKILPESVSLTFHGRDVFAPVAAHLANGAAVRSMGPYVRDLTALALPVPRAITGRIKGEVIHVDRFGNLITNIAADAVAGFSPAQVSVRIAGEQIRGLVPAYTTVPEGALLAVTGSWGLLEIAARNGSASRRLAARRGTPVEVATKSA